MTEKDTYITMHAVFFVGRLLNLFDGYPTHYPLFLVEAPDPTGEEKVTR